MEPSMEECASRIMTVVREHPDSISVEDLCAELRRRGWAFDSLSPASIGVPAGSIIKLPD